MNLFALPRAKGGGDTKVAEPFDNTPDESQVQAPRALRHDLAALFGADASVPPAVDEAVLASARHHLTVRRRARAAIRWAGAAAAAAAAIFLIAIHLGPAREARKTTSEVIFSKADLNHDGRVDILDAFLLAKRLESGRKPLPEWDFDGDGLVDRRDVDAIAHAAVRLHRGTIQ